MKPDQFSALIAKLYEATLDPTEWPRVAQMFARSFDAESCAIFELDLARGSASLMGLTANFDAKAVREYEAYYHRKDVWAASLSRSTTSRAMLNTEMLGDAEFLSTEIYNDFAKRIEMFRFVGSVVTLEKQFKGAIGIHRPHSARAFEAVDKSNLDMLLPHFSRAMLLQRRLGGLTQGNRMVLDALEKLSVGMIAVDAQATLLFANSIAERLLRARLGLTSRRGKLMVSDPTKQEELRRLIQQAGMAALGMQGEAGGVLALPRSQGRPLSLLVCPLPPHALAAGSLVPAALIIFGDPDASRAPPAWALMKLYGLTQTEANLVAALVAGERLEDYAGRQHVSINTARTQIKQVFAKTGHVRQADLMRDVLINPALAAISGPAEGR